MFVQNGLYSEFDDNLPNMFTGVQVLKSLRGLVKGENPVNDRSELHFPLLQECAKCLEVISGAYCDTPKVSKSVAAWVL